MVTEVGLRKCRVTPLISDGSHPRVANSRSAKTPLGGPSLRGLQGWGRLSQASLFLWISLVPHKRRAAVSCLELHDRETGDSLEIAEIQRRDFVAKVQRCRAYQQVLKRKLNPHRFLLAFDAPHQPRDIKRHRMHR